MKTSFDFCAEIQAIDQSGPIIKAIRGDFTRRDPKTGADTKFTPTTIATWAWRKNANGTAPEGYKTLSEFLDDAWIKVQN